MAERERTDHADDGHARGQEADPLVADVERVLDALYGLRQRLSFAGLERGRRGERDDGEHPVDDGPAHRRGGDLWPVHRHGGSVVPSSLVPDARVRVLRGGLCEYECG
jgi:hypothetical protein